MDCSTLGFPVHHHHPELAQTHVHWVDDVIQTSHPLLSCSPPDFNLFQHQSLFFNESVLCIRWPKYWSFSFSISSSNEYSGLISFRFDWLDLLAVQGTLKSLLQHHSSKASILCTLLSLLFNSHIHTWPLEKPYFWLYGICRQRNVSAFYYAARLVTAFLPRSNCLIIPWLLSPSAVILEPKEIKSVTVFIVSPSFCHEVMGPDAMIFVFWMLSFKPTFPLSSLTFIKRLFSSSSLSAIRVVLSAYLRLLIFLPAILIPAFAWSSQNFAWYTLHRS